MEQWRDVERELGFIFPADYREFVFAYGSGTFATEYGVYNPFGGPEYLVTVCSVCGTERDFRAHFPERVPYPVWPEPDGVFPWGCDNNGNEYMWFTAGPSDKWQVVTNEPRGHGYREQFCTMTEYLAGVLLGRITPLIGDFPAPDCFVFVGGEATA